MNFTNEELDCLNVVFKAVLRNMKCANGLPDKIVFSVEESAESIFTKIKNNGGMTKSEVTRSNRGLSRKQRNECLEFLINNGLLEQRTTKQQDAKKHTTHFKPVQAI